MHHCSDHELHALMEAAGTDDRDALRRADRLVEDHPDDARLHFLRGSLLAGIGRPIEAVSALRRAVELAPDFAIARFQLGFFQLTSGEAANALETWGPLALLAENHYLRSFVAGLTHLIRDEFDQSLERLQRGIVANTENPPLNRDMQLIVDKVREVQSGLAQPAGRDLPASAASFLIDQLSGAGRPH